MIKRFIQVTKKDGVRYREELKIDPTYDRFKWGVTAIGCSFELKDGSMLFIHPDSVESMRQYDEESDGKD